MLEKNSIQRATVTDQGKKGEGIVWLADMPVYVPNVIPGDEIEFKVVKVDKRRAYGKLITLHQLSKDRVASKCSVADQCGGANCSISPRMGKSHLRPSF